MRKIPIAALALLLLAHGAAAQTGMKSTAPEKMLPKGEAEKMRACDARAMQENIPMEQKAAFVKTCMAAMK